MGKLLLISLLATVVVAAELSLFPEDSGLLDGTYDEDTLTAQIFGSRERRQAETDVCRDAERDCFDPQIHYKDHVRRGPPGRGGRGPPPGGRGPPPPPPQQGDANGERCPPPPPPQQNFNSSEQAPSGEGMPPPPSGGPGGPGGPGGHGGPGGRGGPGGPGGHRGGHPSMARCCNVTRFTDDSILTNAKECRKEIAAKLNGDSTGRQACGPWNSKNMTRCTFTKNGWAPSDTGSVNVDVLNSKVDSISAMAADEKTFYKSSFNNCAGKNSTEFVFCVRKQMLTACPQNYVSQQCSEQCNAWKARVNNGTST